MNLTQVGEFFFKKHRFAFPLKEMAVRLSLVFFKKWAILGLFLLLFSSFQISKQVPINVQYKFCRWLVSNLGPLESELTAALPTEPQLQLSIDLRDGRVCCRSNFSHEFKFLLKPNFFPAPAQKGFKSFLSLSLSFTLSFLMGQPRPLFIANFRSFQTKIFTTNICENLSIQYTVPGFEATTFGTRVSSHNHYTRALSFFPSVFSLSS